MRIVFVNPVGTIGGAERVLLASIRGARDYLPGAELNVLLFAAGPLEDEAKRLGATVKVLSLPDALARLGDSSLKSPGGRGALSSVVLLGSLAGRIPTTLRFIHRLRRELRSLSPDLIHANGFKAHIMSALAGPGGVPVAWHLHDFLSSRSFMARILRGLRGRVAGAIAVSDAVRHDAERVLPGLKVALVRNAVDTDHFSPAESDPRLLDRLGGLAPAGSDVVRVGIIASYANWKGQDIFIGAIERLVRSRLPVRGYIVGGPIYSTPGSQFTREDLEQRVVELGLEKNVGFVSFQPDPVDIDRMLDIVVHASTRPEPFGLTIVEAMACGKPVVVSSAGGAAELFTHEHDGLGHTPGDAVGLSEMIERLIVDPSLRSRLGTNARRTALERFSHERFGREIAGVFTNLRGGPKSHEAG